MKRPDARGECRRCIYPDYVDELEARLYAAEQVVEAAQRVLDNGVLVEGGVLIADVGVATDLQIEVAKYAAVGGNTP